MKSRCYNKNNKKYKDYGGRGIKVCDKWKNNFIIFYNWSIENGYNNTAKRGECTIDRINNNGNYCPENCRWVNNKTQARNTRNNHNITINGKTKTLSEWVEVYPISISQFFCRKRKGMSDIEALTKPRDMSKVRINNF